MRSLHGLLGPSSFLLSSVLIFLAARLPAADQRLPYPKTKKVDHSDDYHGTKVADPYRWLEDDRSQETAKWVEAENKVTFSYLESIPFRDSLKQRLQQLYNYPKYSSPRRIGDHFIYSKNDGLQNQSVLYIQKGLDGTAEVLLDPNKFSTDGTSQLALFAPSKDGKYCAYGKSTGGSDWVDLFVLETATRKVMPEQLKWVKASNASWWGDGFFYSRYPAPEGGHELSSKNENHQVYFHKVGTPQSSDELVFEDKAHPQRFNGVETTEDQHYAFLDISDTGSGKRGNALFYRDLRKAGSKFEPVVKDITDYQYGVIDNDGDRFLIVTTDRAPNHRIVVYDPSKPGEFKDLVPQKPENLEAALAGGGKLFLTYSQDVATHAYVYSRAGKLENEIQLPATGTAGGFGGHTDDKFVFYSFTTMNYPSTIFRYDIASKKSTVFRAPELPGFRPDAYETKEVFYASKDGTRIPMFLVHKKGLQLNGKNPTLLYGYGGFNISIPPAFDPLRLALLEQGFVYASANLRGGSEYGEKWHEGGMKLNKQKVFDDFISAGEWLITNKYTSADKLAINGASNGGLLVGAVMNQRPDLFRVAVPQVGVMDMLRYQKFTIGWNWAADYGLADNPAEFKVIYGYSPLHNIHDGRKYPATLITTADHDDRVVPAHSFKYAARLQELANPTNPVLIRIETKSGHGASSVTKRIELMTDVYAFMMYNLGVTPKF